MRIYLTLSPCAEGCKSRVVGCGPACWSIPHAVCRGGQCGCGPGFSALSSAAGQLTSCLATITNSSLQADQAGTTDTDINIHYYPGNVWCYFQFSPNDNIGIAEIGILNYWMFAMITIACIFIVFVGVSIYILW